MSSPKKEMQPMEPTPTSTPDVDHDEGPDGTTKTASTSGINPNAPAFVSGALSPDEMTGQEPLPQNVTVLRMRGLPYSATVEDIKEFFADCGLDGEDSVVVINQGFHRGEGYVRFETTQACADAYQSKNRKNIGSRYVELYASTPSAMQMQKEQQDQLLAQQGFIIRLRGLPFTATEADVAAFMGAIQPAVMNIRLGIGPDGRFTGNAFVEVQTEEAMQQAKATLDRTSMGNRYIEVFESTSYEREMQLALDRRNGRSRGQNQQQQPGGPGPFVPGMPGGRGGYAGSRGGFGGGRGGMGGMGRAPNELPVIRVRNLPREASEMEVAEMLNGIRIATSGLHLVLSANNERTGEAFIEVVSDDDANNAVRLASSLPNGVDITISSAAEMRQFQQGPPTPPGPGFAPPTMPPSPPTAPMPGMGPAGFAGMPPSMTGMNPQMVAAAMMAAGGQMNPMMLCQAAMQSGDPAMIAGIMSALIAAATQQQGGAGGMPRGPGGMPPPGAYPPASDPTAMAAAMMMGQMGAGTQKPNESESQLPGVMTGAQAAVTGAGGGRGLTHAFSAMPPDVSTSMSASMMMQAGMGGAFGFPNPAGVQN